MAENLLKQCLTYLVIIEMQIKITLRFHLIPIRMAKIKNSSDRTCFQECGEKITLLQLLVGLQVGTTTLKFSIAVLQKIGKCSTWRHSYSVSGHIPKRNSTRLRPWEPYWGWSNTLHEAWRFWEMEELPLENRASMKKTKCENPLLGLRGENKKRQLVGSRV